MNTGNVNLTDLGKLQLGTNQDFLIYHNGNDAIVRNYQGGFFIDQAAVTESTEAYEHLNKFIDAVKDTIKDEEILKKLRRAKVEMIEAQHAVAKVLKGWKK